MKKIRTIELHARCDIIMTKAQMKVDEWNAYIIATEEQFNRIVDSYSEGKFKQMNEDEAIADLYELFANAGKTSDKQTLHIDYPFVVQNGMTFEEVYKVQHKKWTAADRKAWVEEFLAKENIEAKTESVMKRLSASLEEQDARYRAIDELRAWMEDRGFDPGQEDCNLLDDDGWCIEALDIGWPNGIYGMKGCTKPVAVQFFHTTPELLEMAREQGFEVFESIEAFKDFIEKNCMGGNR